MSRAERERWKLGAERWPHLQDFVSTCLASDLFAIADDLPRRVKEAVTALPLESRTTIANEYWDWKAFFARRYDEKSFLRDGFGVLGRFPGGDQDGLRRMKLLYDALAESIRAELGSDWKPGI